MKKSIGQLAVFLIAAVVSSAVFAESQPFNLSLTPDTAIYPRTDTIEGITLSAWGENQQTSLALGFVNGTTGDSAGLCGGLLINYANDYKGIQWAAVNNNKDNFFGWQSGLVDFAKGTMTGLQAGVINFAGRLTGLEIGLVNCAKDVDAGLQIGFINIIQNNKGWFDNLPNSLAPVMIMVNW